MVALSETLNAMEQADPPKVKVVAAEEYKMQQASIEQPSPSDGTAQPSQSHDDLTKGMRATSPAHTPEEVAKAIKFLESCGATVQAPPQDTDLPAVKPDYSKIENNEGFTLCMKCGGPLPPSDDGKPKYRRQPEACYECVHKDADKMKCEDGVVRDKDDCKRVTTMVGKDEVYTWVKK